MGQPTPLTTAGSFKSAFARDFSYGPGLDKVRDADINRAIVMASTLFNADLFDTTLQGVSPDVTSESQTAYHYLTAHFLVSAVQAAGGLSKTGRGVYSQGEGVISSKGAGGMNVGYNWPSIVTDSPALFQLVKTTYGQMYLQILMPRLVGNVGVVGGQRESDLGGTQ